MRTHETIMLHNTLNKLWLLFDKQLLILDTTKGYYLMKKNQLVIFLMNSDGFLYANILLFYLFLHILYKLDLLQLMVFKLAA